MTSDNDLRQAAHINARRADAAAAEIERLKAEVERLTRTSAAAKENRDGLLKAMIDKDAEITRLEAEVERLRTAAQEFCRRVEAGEIRSTRSYAQFRAALTPSQERHLSLNEQAVMHSALRQSVTKEPRT